MAQKILQEGIDLKGYFIYGFPQETECDFQQTFELARKISNISQTTEGNFRTSVFNSDHIMEQSCIMTLCLRRELSMNVNLMT